MFNNVKVICGNGPDGGDIPTSKSHLLKVKAKGLGGSERYLSVSGETKAELYNVLSQFGVTEGGPMDLFTTHCCECADIVYTEEEKI